MGVDWFVCNGCEIVINDGGYPQCSVCREYFCNECAGCFTKIEGSDYFICEKCLIACDHCHEKTTSNMVYCFGCKNSYDEDCFGEYLEDENIEAQLEYHGEKLKSEYYDDSGNLKGELKDLIVSFVSKCGWCSKLEKTAEPQLFTKKNCPENSCPICWVQRKSQVEGTIKKCICGQENLCKAHGDRHACEYRVKRKQLKRYMIDNEEVIKNHIFKKLRTKPEKIEKLCKDLENFPEIN